MILQVVGIVLFAFILVGMVILAIGAVVINLFDRERKRNGRQVQKTDKKSDK